MGTSTLAAIAMLFAAASLAALAARFRELAGTTLRAPWWWAITSVLFISAAQLLCLTQIAADAFWTSHLRYAAAVSSFCPLMAILGAKRPQDRGWQFVVLSLLGILLLPALEALLHRPQAPLLLHGARQWFLLVLVVVGLINNLPTRFWPSSLLAAMGQVVLLREHLPWLASRHFWTEHGGCQADVMLGIALLTAALLLWSAKLPRARPAQHALDRVWLDFRDSFGVVWALRVADRFNHTAALCQWPMRLGWHGLEGKPADTDSSSKATSFPPDAERTLRTLLRRFVSSDWISRRMAEEPGGE